MTQTWLITGANRGIGFQYVAQCLAAGEQVIATARNPEAAADLQALAVRYPGQLRIEALEAGDPASIAALAERLAGVPVDILLNNAGINRSSWPTAEGIPPQESDYAVWADTLRVNLYAPFAVTLALQGNLKLGQRKLVVMMSSDLGSITSNTLGGSYAYRASKAGLNMVTKGLSIDLAGAGITVVSMAPGWVRTDLGGSAGHWAVEDSVANQLKVIAGMDASASGHFINLEGQAVAW